MKKCLLRGIAVAAITGFVLALRAQDATTTDQSQYPVILQQPVDQCLPVGSSVTFSILASNVDSYQWYKNSAALDGQTNSSLTIASVAISDVAYYSAAVIKGSDSVPTRMANLNVYTTGGSTVPTPILGGKSRLALTQSMGMASPMDLGGGGVITVFGAPVTSGGNSSGCPGAYAGYVNYVRTVSQGWGWAPTAGTQVLSAADLNRADTKVQAMGKVGDMFCDQTTVNIATPAYSSEIPLYDLFPARRTIADECLRHYADGFRPIIDFGLTKRPPQEAAFFYFRIRHIANRIAREGGLETIRHRRAA